MDRRRSPPTPPPDEGPARKRPAFDPGLLSSPFYRGPTAYGGAGARNALEPRARLPSLYERRRVDARAVRAVGRDSDSGEVGQTTKRIRELLAHCSSPLSDAKRALASPSSRSFAPASASSSACGSTEAPRRLRELRLPAMATLLRLKRNNRTVGSAQAAIAASLSSSLPYRPEDYVTRTDTEVHKNKLRAKINGRNRNNDEETPPTRVILPDAKLDLGGKEMPKIVFDTPPVKRFTFRNPLDAQDPKTERLQFIDMFGAKAPVKRSASIGVNAPDDDRPRNGPLRVSEEPPSKIVAPTPPEPPAPIAPVVDAGFASIMKKQKSQWECDSCLSRNDDGAAACVCCEAPKPGKTNPPVPAPRPIPPAPTTNGPGLAGLVQKQKAQWECDCCLARNEPDRQKCVCCEAPKPGAAPVQSVKFNFGSSSAGGFKFGINEASSPTKTAPSAIGLPEKTEKNEGKEPAVTSGFKFGVPPPASKEEAKAPAVSFGIPNGNVSTGTTKTEPPAPQLPLFGIKNDAPKSGPPEPFSFGIKPAAKESPKAVEKVGSVDSSKTAVGFGFLQNQNTSKEEVKNVDNSKINENTLNIIKSPVSSITSPQITEVKPPTTLTPTTVPEKASLFSFGSTGTTSFGFSSPPTFNFSAATTEAPKTTFGSSEVFSFSSPPTDTKSKPDSVPKFSSPLSNLVTPKIAFSTPSTTAAISIPSQESITSKDTPLNKPTGVLFQSPAVGKNEQSAPALLFSFTSSAAPPSVPSVTSNTFKSNNTSALPVFTFGAAPVSKPPETTSLPFSNQVMSPSNIFSNQPPSEINKTPNSDTIFKTNSAPVTSSFSSITTNIFGSKPSTVSSPPSTNLFGNNQPGENKPAASIFGSAPLNNSSTTQLPQANSIFSNPPSQPAPFNSGSIFGSPALSNSTNPPQTNLFGSPAMNKPATGPESGTGLFGSKTQSAPSSGFFGGNLPTGGAPSLSSGGIFGSHPAVPTPVFGASIPFGEASQTQPAQNVPFKFGASNQTQPPVAGFGQVPSAGSSAPVFSFGSSAVPAPSMNSQFNFSMGAPTPAFPSTPGVNPGMPPRRFKRAVRRNGPR